MTVPNSQRSVIGDLARDTLGLGNALAWRTIGDTLRETGLPLGVRIAMQDEVWIARKTLLKGAREAKQARQSQGSSG